MEIQQGQPPQPPSVSATSPQSKIGKTDEQVKNVSNRISIKLPEKGKDRKVKKTNFFSSINTLIGKVSLLFMKSFSKIAKKEKEIANLPSKPAQFKTNISLNVQAYVTLDPDQMQSKCEEALQQMHPGYVVSTVTSRNRVETILVIKNKDGSITKFKESEEEFQNKLNEAKNLGLDEIKLEIKNTQEGSTLHFENVTKKEQERIKGKNIKLEELLKSEEKFRETTKISILFLQEAKKTFPDSEIFENLLASAKQLENDIGQAIDAFQLQPTEQEADHKIAEFYKSEVFKTYSENLKNYNDNYMKTLTNEFKEFKNNEKYKQLLNEFSNAVFQDVNLTREDKLSYSEPENALSTIFQRFPRHEMLLYDLAKFSPDSEAIQGAIDQFKIIKESMK